MFFPSGAAFPGSCVGSRLLLLVLQAVHAQSLQQWLIISVLLQYPPSKLASNSIQYR